MNFQKKRQQQQQKNNQIVVKTRKTIFYEKFLANITTRKLKPEDI